MASSSGTIQTGIQVALVIVIAGLAYFLYQSITEPYERIERQQRITEDTRTRMANIRTALVDYERDSAAYPDSLNLLLQHIRKDTILSTRQDSVFGAEINLDSLLYSPRSGTRFPYTVRYGPGGDVPSGRPGYGRQDWNADGGSHPGECSQLGVAAA